MNDGLDQELPLHDSPPLAVVGPNPFEAYAQAVNSSPIVGKLLKFSKGDYTVDDTVVNGQKLIANLDELIVGWVKWVGGKPAEQIMGRVVDRFQPPKRVELDDAVEATWETDNQGKPRDPWQVTNYLILKDPEGEDLYTFAGNSKGALGAIGKLSGEYGKHMRIKPNEFPIVQLDVDSYQHQDRSFGRIKFPVFKIVGWAPKSGFSDAIDAAVESAAEKAETRF